MLRYLSRWKAGMNFKKHPCIHCKLINATFLFIIQLCMCIKSIRLIINNRLLSRLEYRLFNFYTLFQCILYIIFINILRGAQGASHSQGQLYSTIVCCHKDPLLTISSCMWLWIVTVAIHTTQGVSLFLTIHISWPSPEVVYISAVWLLHTWSGATWNCCHLNIHFVYTIQPWTSLHQLQCYFISKPHT